MERTGRRTVTARVLLEAALEWLTYLGTAVGAAVGGIAIYDRLQRARRRIGADFSLILFPGQEPPENPWDPPVPSDEAVDAYLARVTIYNNADEPIALEGWAVTGIPNADGEGRDYAVPIDIRIGELAEESFGFAPDWIALKKATEHRLPWFRSGHLRVSVTLLLRASSRRVRVRSERYTIPSDIIRKNAVKALATSAETIKSSSRV